ncbi:MAG: U32 family peptidase [Promethearchaeota archaeon]
MILYTIGTSFDQSLLDFFDDLNQKYSECKIIEMYGSLQNDPIGTSRERWRLPNLSFKNLENYIRKANKYNIKFNYTFNNVLVDPVFLFKNEKQILNFVKRLIDIGTDSITIAHPLLMKFVKKHFPNFKIFVSTITNTRTIQEARYFDGLGVSRIILSLFINRNFRMLKNIRESVKCDLECMTNEFCIINCPNRIWHYIVQSGLNRESLKKNEYDNIPFCRYPYNDCFRYMVRDIVHIVYNPWIRPEDIKYYKQIGISHFKIVGRTWPTEQIKIVVEAYMKQHFDGNLLDLGPFYWKGKSIFSHMRIDNRKMDGFIDYFINNEYRCDTDCNISCFYCKKWVYERILDFNK